MRKLLLRIILFFARLFCRVRLRSDVEIPKSKGGLIVCNHVSLIDGLLLMLALKRPIRFIVDKYYYEKKMLKPLCKLLNVIAIGEHEGCEGVLKSLEEARKAIQDGEIVCVFAEGSITRNGMMMRFRAGFKRIMEGVDCDVWPAFIGGAWETVFSYRYGKPLSSVPRNLPYRIDVYLGEPMEQSVSAVMLRQKVSELGSDYFAGLKESRRPMGEMFVRAARKNWFRKAVSDSSGKSLSYGRLLVASLTLKNKLEQITSGQENVGLLLPSSVGSAIANIAINLLGKVSVNLNYTASEEARNIAVKQCGLKTVLTSKVFLKKAGDLEKRDEYVYLEDLLKTICKRDKIKAAVKAIFWPKKKLCADSRGAFDSDKTATIMFSSGSSGRPKGVMLSHHNLISNIEAMRMVFKFTLEDDILGVLPIFHCFGYNCTLWLPLLSGVSVSYVPNPLDCDSVGKTAKENKSTILLATPTFISNYTRRISADCFEKLRLVVVGAEKLKQSIADRFKSKFGKDVFEGYGATELSPVAALNLEDIETHKGVQKGHKPGAIGCVIPGITAKVVDLENGEDVSGQSRGLLLVRGSNVMKGYLDMPEETKDVLKDGWYNTGDVVEMDNDGFITLQDRLSRFSKIAGEMVPHVASEEILFDACGLDCQAVAVTGVPHERKGEELVVLYLPDVKDKIDEMQKKVSDSDLPNIWKPKNNNYYEVAEIPILGTGKLDILMLKKLAIEAVMEAK